MTETRKDLRNYLFRGLLFEAEAESFRQAGIRVGADMREAERNLLEEVLTPFDVTMRNEALQMARLYALIYCFENSVRALIQERLLEKHGDDWWNSVVSEKIKKTAETRKQTATKDSWLEGQKKSLLGFVDFGNLAVIIVTAWDDFSDLIPSQQWLCQRMDEMEKARNFIAHNRILLPGEFQRLEMYVADWNRMVGF